MEQNGLRAVTYVDADGRRWARLLPPQAPDGDAEWGIPAGPPSLRGLGLPVEMEVRLHNELHARGILSERAARRRFGEIAAALMAALRVDAGRVLDIYRGTGTEGARHASSSAADDPEIVPEPDLHRRGKGRAG